MKHFRYWGMCTVSTPYGQKKNKFQFQPCLIYFTDKAPFCLSFSHPFSSEVTINQMHGVVFTLQPCGFLLLLSELQVCILVHKFM